MQGPAANPRVIRIADGSVVPVMPATPSPEPTPKQKAAVPSVRRMLGAGLVLAAATTLAACGGGAAHGGSSTSPGASGSATAAPSTPSSRAHVTVKNFAFTPATLTVKPGATITITNADSVPHTFTARDGAFNTGDIAPGKTATVTAPTKPGKYPFYCLIHQFMTGTLTVA